MDNNDLASLKDQLVKEYLADPRNKIHVSLKILTLSASEETGKNRKPSEINKIIEKYTEGDLDDAGTEIYDGAVAVCGSLARHCFAGDPDAEVDYEIDWLEDADGYIAEVRPC